MPLLGRLFCVVPTTVICSQNCNSVGNSWYGLADAMLDKLWGLPVAQTMPADLEREFHISGSEILGLLGMAPLVCQIGVCGLLDRGGRVVNLRAGAVVVVPSCGTFGYRWLELVNSGGVRFLMDVPIGGSWLD